MANIGKLTQFNPQGQKPTGKGGGSQPTPQAALLKKGGPAMPKPIQTKPGS
jgi:hypothetical protein